MLSAAAKKRVKKRKATEASLPGQSRVKRFSEPLQPLPGHLRKIVRGYVGTTVGPITPAMFKQAVDLAITLIVEPLATYPDTDQGHKQALLAAALGSMRATMPVIPNPHPCFNTAVDNGHLRLILQMSDRNYHRAFRCDSNSLRELAKYGYLDVLKCVWYYGDECSDVERYELCMTAVKHKRATVVRWLIVDEGGDRVIQQWMVDELLCEAVLLNHRSIAEHLLGAKADVSDNDNWAVQCAAEFGHTSIVELLIEAKADITVPFNAPLKSAARNGYLEMVPVLLGAKADVTTCKNYPIRYAARRGYLQVVQVLLRAKADATADHNYALVNAARNKHQEVAQVLIAAKADVSEAMDQSAQLGYAAAVDFLINLL